ncbi:MAG: hypothetical protein ACPG4Z_02595 [Chitinophagales bacterium]
MRWLLFYLMLFVLVCSCSNSDTNLSDSLEEDITDSLSIVNELVDENLTESVLLDSIETYTQLSEEVKGDYNGDGKLEMMWLESPSFFESTAEDEYWGECDGLCDCYIRFSDEEIAPIKVSTCIGGFPTNYGDLNDNGGDEIGLLPQWWTSCWRAYFVWTYIDDEWQNAVEPFSTHCIQSDMDLPFIEIDESHDGNVIVRYSEMNDSIEIVEKSVPIGK